MIRYTVCDRFTDTICSAFRIAYDFQEMLYLKEKYGFCVTYHDVGKFLIVQEGINGHTAMDSNSFNARYRIVDQEPIYPWIPSMQ